MPSLYLDQDPKESKQYLELKAACDQAEEAVKRLNIKVRHLNSELETQAVELDRKDKQLQEASSGRQDLEGKVK